MDGGVEGAMRSDAVRWRPREMGGRSSRMVGCRHLANVFALVGDEKLVSHLP